VGKLQLIKYRERFKMIIILYIILIYSLLGSLTFLIGQRLHTKNKNILTIYYWIVFIFSPVIDLIIKIDEIFFKQTNSNISGSELEENEK
jgi:hypothetical protein